MLLATLASGLSKRSVVFLSSGSKKVGRSNRSFLIVEIPRWRKRVKATPLLFSFSSLCLSRGRTLELVIFWMTFPIQKNSSPFPVFELFSNALNSQMGGGEVGCPNIIKKEKERCVVRPKPIQEPFYLICYSFFSLTLSDSISTNGIKIIIEIQGWSSAFFEIRWFTHLSAEEGSRFPVELSLCLWQDIYPLVLFPNHRVGCPA